MYGDCCLFCDYNMLHTAKWEEREEWEEWEEWEALEARGAR